MLRSMFTAISSLSLHQTFMDVVADNLANVNTPGFKSSSVTFQDQFAQLISAGAAPTAELGGINPVQIGLGARLGTISTAFNQGTMQFTGKETDLAIQGGGFFIYEDGNVRCYSREGSLTMDSEGYLVNAGTGMRIMGWQAISTSGSAAAIDTGRPIGAIQIPVDSIIARATQNVIMGGNLDATSPTGASGAIDVTFGAYDSLGVLHTISIEFTKTSDNNWDWTATSGASGNGTLSFDNDGQYLAGGGTVTIPASGGAAATVIDLDMSSVSQLAMASNVASVSQDGVAAGSLNGFSVISSTGEIYGTYTNGLQRLLGQVALASFVNPAGLIRSEGNLFLAGLNSGDPEIGTAGTSGRGTLSSGYLEASNVDLGREFTNMILAQRGFQASSRIISASDEMLQELVNIAR